MFSLARLSYGYDMGIHSVYDNYVSSFLISAHVLFKPRDLDSF